MLFETLFFSGFTSHLALTCGFLFLCYACWPVKAPKNYPPGILFRSGKEWKEIRGFTMKTLKTYGMNNAVLEPIVTREAEALVERLKEMAASKKPQCTLKLVKPFAFHILGNIISGKKMLANDQQIEKLIDHCQMWSDSPVPITLMYMYPWLSKIFYAFPSKFKTSQQALDDFFGNYVRERRLSSENVDTPIPVEVGDFTAAFLEKIKITTEMNDVASIFHGENGYKELVELLKDLKLAGIETSVLSLSWLLFLLALHPEKQKKLQDEIDRELKGRFFTLEHKIRLPYLEAVINETLRKSSIGNIGIPRFTSEPLKIDSYNVPKGVWVSCSMYSFHHDVGIWGDPENFRPERFLTQENTLIKHEAFMPFGVGKRSCPGELIARNKMFIFAVSIFSRFSVKLNPQEPRPSINFATGFLLKPQPHTIIVEERFVQPN